MRKVTLCLASIILLVACRPRPTPETIKVTVLASQPPPKPVEVTVLITQPPPPSCTPYPTYTPPPRPAATPKPTAIPTILPPSLEEIVLQTLGSGYIFEQSYLGSAEGPNVLVVETRARGEHQIAFIEHILFFVETLHARPFVSGVKLVVFPIDALSAYSIFVRASDIRLFEQGEIDELHFLMRWYLKY